MIKPICANQGLDKGLIKSSKKPMQLPGALSSGHFQFTASGRIALFYAWQALNPPKGTEILTPSFICNTVTQPLIAAGASIKFYQTQLNGTYNWDEMDSATTQINGVFLWVHFLGFAGEFEKALSYCKRKNLILIEDCTHALLTKYNNRPVGTFGDIAVFSFRKNLPTLSGGALKINNKDISYPQANNNAIKAKTKKDTLHAFKEYRQNILKSHDKKSINTFLMKQPQIDCVLNDIKNPYTLDTITINILKNCNLESIVYKSRENYNLYLQHLRSVAFITELKDGDVPIGFPIFINNRDQTRLHLEDKHIYPICHWPEYLLPIESTQPNTIDLQIANKILTLPCTPNHSKKQIFHVIKSVKQIIKNINSGANHA